MLHYNSEKKKGTITYRIGEPPVGDVGSLLVYTHHLFHVLEAGVTRYYIMEGGFVVFYNTCINKLDTFISLFFLKKVIQIPK